MCISIRNSIYSSFDELLVLKKKSDFLFFLCALQEVKDTIEKEMVWEFSKDDKDIIKRIRVKMDITDVILEHGELYIKVINKEKETLLGNS